MSTLIHNPRCRKSREAKNLLEAKGIQFDIREYLRDELSKEELSKILTQLDRKPSEILRKGEAVFKEKFKGKDLADDEWIAAMVENPKLIERPIFIHGDKAVVGRPPENVLSLL